MKARAGSLGLLRLLALALIPASISAAAHAGVLCGAVRDASTGDVVAGAGVFVRLESGAYTGLHAATDETGSFCITAVPAGTYDLEVRRDDYRVAYRRHVTVSEGTVGVELSVADTPAVLMPPFPNPARNRVDFTFRLEAPVPAALTVHDVRGRLVFGWSSTGLGEGTHRQSWNFLDQNGSPVASGLYFVRLSTGGFSRTRTLIHLR